MATTQKLTELPAIQYSGIDYDTIMSEMKDIIANNPNWKENWASFYNSEAGTLFMQLMAWISDNLGLRMDTLYNEMFISTAQKDKDILKMLKLIGYAPTLANAAKVYVTIELSAASSTTVTLKKEKSTFSTVASNIISVTGKDINGGKCNYEILQCSADGKPNYISGLYLSPTSSNSDSIKYTNTSDGSKLYLLQGKTNYQTFTSSTSDGPYFDITDSNIAQNSIRVYDIEKGKEHYQVDNFLQPEARDSTYGIPYVIEYTENGYTRIRYASSDIIESSERRFSAGNTIIVFYRTCNGSLGNVPANFINTTVNLLNSKGETVSATIYNDSTGINGSDQETVSKAAENGPLTLRTMNRAVTPSDYDTLLNKYGMMLKSKSYTSSNAPSNFKDYYGRYINPQEVFSFVILNKDYSSIPASEYNYYPWINLRLNNMFNEKYSFDTAEYNKECTVSESIYGKLKLTFEGNNIDYFDNASILNINDDFNNAVSTGSDSYGKTIYNDKLKLKLQRTTSSLKHFSNILADLIYDENSDPKFDSTNDLENAEKNCILTTTDNSATLNTYARYIPSEGKKIYSISDSTDVTKKYYVFDASQYGGKISLCLDGRSIVTIDLFSENNGLTPTEKYYMALDNGAYSDLDISDRKKKYDFTDFSGKETDALYRKSLIELINDQFLQIDGGDSSNEFYYNNMSIQHLNLGMPNKNNIISELTQGGYYTFKLNGNTYAIYLNEKDTPISGDSFFNSIENIAASINSVFTKKIIKDSSTADYNLYIYNEDTGTFQNIYDYYKNKGEYNNASIPNVECHCINIGSSNNIIDVTSPMYNTYDIVFTQKADSEDTSVTINITEKPTHFYNEGKTDRSLIEYITSKTLPKAEPSAVYYKIASVINSSEDGEDVQYFQIKSPTVGENSSIFFKKPDNNSKKDIMSELFDVKYNNGEIYSSIAYGQKILTLLKENSVVATNIIDSMNSNSNTALSNPVKGNVIFECNSINLPYNIKKIYASYKLDSNNEVELGSIYDNYYYTGDPDIDSNYKPKLSGMLGQYMEKTVEDGKTIYTLEPNKSDYVIKLTSEKVDTNSIYAIKDSELIDAIPIDTVSVVTADFSKGFGGSGSFSVPLYFSIDEMNKENKSDDSVRFGPFNNIVSGLSSDGIYSIINSTMENYSNSNKLSQYTYAQEYSSIIKKDISSMNRLVFSNLLKTSEGNITFWYPDGSEQNNVNEFYKNFLGTNITNSELYKLYPKSMFDESLVHTVSTSEYYYAPTASLPLKITYRKLVSKTIDGVTTEVSTYPDYYIKSSGKKNDSERSNYYTFTLCKTENSNFQDTPFYVNIVNDRTYELDINKNSIELEEDTLQTYMNKYKISGMEINFLKPYFKTFDIGADITYDRNFAASTIKSTVEAALKEEFSLSNMKISQSISKSKIYKIIMNVSGVNSVKINYFGFNYLTKSSESLPDESIMTADFYEILVLHENVENQHGLIFSYSEDSE
jgi:hypothetical protein